MKDNIINLQVSFNKLNRSHCEILDWINIQTTNKSSFIRESLLMRMIRTETSLRNVSNHTDGIDVNEALSIIQI